MLICSVLLKNSILFSYAARFARSVLMCGCILQMSENRRRGGRRAQQERAAQQEVLTEELERRSGEVEAINAALESLKAADDQLRERFSPAINARAGEYLSALTGGKYATAALTRQFQALAGTPDAGIQRRDLLLSGGTAQQLYLALRLAMCDLALPRDEPCPILLDDTLDSFDDARARLALDCLLEVAGKRQVLLFTCHSREKALLEGKSATVVEL